jgi:hypothetical protein
MCPHSKTLEIYSSKQTLQANKSLGSLVNYLFKTGLSSYLSSITWLYLND